jgi:hypothetical protein
MLDLNRILAMQQRELWVRLDAGLCNRLRVLVSSIGLAQMTGRKLFVYWPVTRKWKIGPIRLRRAAGRFEATLEDLCTGPFTTVSNARWKAVLASADAFKSGHPPDPAVSARVVHLQTIHDFYGVLDRPAHEVARELRPQQALQQRIDAFLKGWSAGDGPTIGVHIRSHQAHEKTEQHSPVSWFERRIGELLADCPSSRFFLSTDAARVSRRLHERFPGRIHEQITPPGYNTREGIQKGLTDLYILARCDYILGSYWSSFSDMAALLQGERGYEDSQVRKGIDVARIQTGGTSRTE